MSSIKLVETDNHSIKNLIQLEEIGKFIISYAGSIYLGYAWWVFPAWLLAPDLSMIGYVINNRVGAYVYNLFHHQGFAIVIGLSGIMVSDLSLQLAGLVLFGHSAMDRALGYGLKYTDNFKHTHLGWIGKQS